MPLRADSGSQPQHMTALQYGQTIRLARSQLHKDVFALPLAAGREKVADLLDHRHPAIQTMRVADLLGWVRRNSHRAISQALESAGVSEFALVRELTDRQIIALVEVLELQAETSLAWRRGQAAA